MNIAPEEFATRIVMLSDAYRVLDLDLATLVGQPINSLRKKLRQPRYGCGHGFARSADGAYLLDCASALAIFPKHAVPIARGFLLRRCQDKSVDLERLRDLDKQLGQLSCTPLSIGVLEREIDRLAARS